MVGFQMRDRQIKFHLPMPDRDAPEVWRTANKGLERSPEQAANEYDKAVRQKWRAHSALHKAKLEAVESGIGERGYLSEPHNRDDFAKLIADSRHELDKFVARHRSDAGDDQPI